jgi:hypothetical protein
MAYTHVEMMNEEQIIKRLDKLTFLVASYGIITGGVGIFNVFYNIIIHDYHRRPWIYQLYCVVLNGISCFLLINGIIFMIQFMKA